MISGHEIAALSCVICRCAARDRLLCQKQELKSVAAIKKMNIINNMKSHVSLHLHYSTCTSVIATKLSKHGEPMP